MKSDCRGRKASFRVLTILWNVRYKITIIAFKIEEGFVFCEEYDNIVEERRKNGIVEIVPESK